MKSRHALGSCRWRHSWQRSPASDRPGRGGCWSEGRTVEREVVGSRSVGVPPSVACQSPIEGARTLNLHHLTVGRNTLVGDLYLQSVLHTVVFSETSG